MSHRVASRLDHRDLPAALIRQTFDEAIARDPSIGEAFHADIMAVADRDPACLRMMEPLLYFKGFQALQAYRLSHWLLKAGRRDFALSLQSLASAVFGVDINPAAHLPSTGSVRYCSRPRRHRRCARPTGAARRAVRAGPPAGARAVQQRMHGIGVHQPEFGRHTTSFSQITEQHALEGR